MADDARDYVAQLYQQELGRSGDAAMSDPGLQAWADAIASGAMSREAVQQAIAGSQEGVRYDIGQAYERELGAGRSTSGDPGLQQWVNAVTGGGMTTQQAIDQIARSQEAARYDIAREYGGTLQRQGTYEQMAAKDPGIAQWEQALMNGSVTEQQFRNAILQSQEYKGLQGGTKTPAEDPNAKIIQDLKNTIAANQKAFEAQQQAWAQQQKAWEEMIANTAKNQAALTSGFQRQIQPLQQSLLGTNATENATRGFFSPATTSYAPTTVPTYSPAVNVPGAAAPGTAAPVPSWQGSFTPTTGAQTGPATSIAPAPGYFVPQTYLAPAPPQYRNVNPFTPMFGSPSNSPFESYYNIATRRFGYPYPAYGQQGQGYQAPYLEGAPASAPATTTTPTG